MEDNAGNLRIDALLEDIFGYIGYLRQSCALDVTVHMVDHTVRSCMDRLLTCNIHTNPFCVYLKTDIALWQQCIDRQGKVLSKAQAGEYCGMCWAGMTEWIYPVRQEDGTAIGFICVSGYGVNHPQAMQRIDAVCAKYEVNRGELVKIFDQQLKREIPSRDALSPIIRPLTHMFSLLIHLTRALDEAIPGTAVSSATLFAQITHYLNRYYATNITLDTLSKRFNCSVSYLSRLFHRYGHQNFRQYINTLRVHLAQTFLASTQMSVQEITYAVGFTDSNYFSTVFRRTTGLSPRDWRRQSAEKAKELELTPREMAQ